MLTRLDVTSPEEGRKVIKKNYWICQDGDPTKALFNGEHPQCNPVEDFALMQATGKSFEVCNPGVVFIETAYSL